MLVGSKKLSDTLHSASALLPIHEAQKANKTSQKHARCLIFDPSKSDLASRIQCLLFASLLFPFPSLFFLHWQVISVNSKNSTSLDLMVSSFQMCHYNLFSFSPPFYILQGCIICLNNTTNTPTNNTNNKMEEELWAEASRPFCRMVTYHEPLIGH